MENYILDENDCPRLVELHEYFEWQKQLPENIRTGVGFTLARDTSPDADVSTVYLGFDHGYDLGPPLLWETMVFCEGDDNNDCLRAATRAEALDNHRKFVEKYIGNSDEQVRP